MEKALIFDLDGTLVDSLADISAAVDRTLAALGRPPLPPGLVAHFVGSGLPSTLRRALAAATPPAPPDDDEFQVISRRFMADYQAHCAVATRAYPGVAETLDGLATAGWRMAVCTNKHTGVARAILDALALTPFFSAVAGIDAVPAAKPDPGHVRHCLAALDVPAHRAVVVGDSEQDRAAATAAGCAFVVAAYGYGRLAADRAPLRVTSFAALPGVVAGLPPAATGA